MKTQKTMIIALFLFIFLLTVVVNASSFKDTFNDNINSEIRVYLSGGASTDERGGFPNSSYFQGILVEVQDDYIKIRDSKHEIYIKIEDISAYRVVKKQTK